MSSPLAKHRVNSICNKSVGAFKKENWKSKTQIILLIHDLILFGIYDFYSPVTFHVFHSSPFKNSCRSSKSLQKSSPDSVTVAEDGYFQNWYILTQLNPHFPLQLVKLSSIITQILAYTYIVQGLCLRKKRHYRKCL